MTIHPICKITIGNYVFNYVHSVKIEQTWKELGSFATVQFPNIARFEGFKNQLEDKIKIGQRVSIELGYSQTGLFTEFEGYISEIKPNIPFEIKVEDEFYTLKKSNKITKSYAQVEVKKLLKELVPEVTIAKETPTITIDNFLIRDATKAEVLQELKNKYLLTMYYRGKNLFVGLPYTEKINSEPARYHLQRNVVSTNLQYQSKENIKLQIKAISILKDGKKIEVEVGDKDGQVRTLNYQNITDKEVLKKIATTDLEKYKYDGYTGSITALGYPYCSHGFTAEIVDDFYPERAGDYAIDKVSVSFGANGFRREVELGARL